MKTLQNRYISAHHKELLVASKEHTTHQRVAELRSKLPDSTACTFFSFSLEKIPKIQKSCSNSAVNFYIPFPIFNNSYYFIVFASYLYLGIALYIHTHMCIFVILLNHLGVNCRHHDPQVLQHVSPNT